MTAFKLSFEQWCYEQHDVVCNQKYDRTLPYSFHLKLVAAQVQKFQYLLDKEELQIALNGAYGHDLLEDARKTYNDIIQYGVRVTVGNNNYDVGKKVADVIFACTEDAGRTREERHSPNFFKRLRENEIGTFVKLCDLIANISYGLLTNSSMYEKYKKEYPHVKEEIYIERFKPLFDYLEYLFKIDFKPVAV